MSPAPDPQAVPPPPAPKKLDVDAYRPLIRLLPWFRPYLGRMALLVLFTLGYAASDTGRALLVEPLINDVLLRGGSLRGHLEDEELASGAVKATVDEEAAKVAALDSATLDALKKDPRFGLSDHLALDAGDVDATSQPVRLRKLVRRTARTLVRAADDPALPADHPMWPELGKAVLLARHAAALGLAPGADQKDRRVAGKLSLIARQVAFDAGWAAAQPTLWWVFWWSVGLAVSLAVFHYLVFFLSRSLTARIFVDFQNRLAEHLLTLSVRFFEGERRGDILSRLTADLALTSNVVNALSGDLLTHAIRLSVLVVSALVLSWQLSLSLVLVAGLILGPLRSYGKRQRRASRKRQGATGDVLDSMQQMLAGLRVVKSFQREEHEERRLGERVTLSTEAQIKAVRAREGAKTWLQFMNDVTVPLMMMGGGLLVVKQMWGLDAGTLGTFLGLVLLMYLPTKAMGEAYGTLNDSLPALERVFQLLDARPDLVDAKDAIDPGPVRQAVRFESVSFSYGADTPTLVDVTFEAAAGTTTAIVGATGSGKSTLVDLIARYRDPTGGRITIDGHDLRQVKLEAWLSRLAVVQQQPFLFNDSVLTNVRYGRLDATREEVEEACRQAHVHDEVAPRPGGYDAPVGERGGKLSGGQAARVAIARALVKRPDVLILDEATRALDTTTERNLQRALAEARGPSGNRPTTFVIAHRLSTVQSAEQILVLDKGRLVERGTHEALIRQGGVYADLVARQQMDDAAR